MGKRLARAAFARAAWLVAVVASWPALDCAAAGVPPRIVLDQVYASNGQRLKTDLGAFLAGADPDVASPIRRPQLAKTPVYLFHGKADELVPVAQSLSLAQALQAQGGKVLLRVFDGVGHEVMLPNPHLGELLDELTRFLGAVDAA